jgi:hypothetical protein
LCDADVVGAVRVNVAVVTPPVVLRGALAVATPSTAMVTDPLGGSVPGGGVPAVSVTVAVKLAPAATAAGAEIVGVVWLFAIVTTNGGTDAEDA